MATVFYDYEQLNRMNTKQMSKVLKDYAKTANQRLRELEKAGVARSSSAYRQVLDWHGQGQNFIRVTEGNIVRGRTTQSGLVKFRTSTNGMTLNEMRQEVSELHTFLFRAKTSTVRGTRTHYKRILESIQHNANQEMADYFRGMSMEDFTSFWENEAFRRIIQRYGSDIVVEIKRLSEEEQVTEASEIISNILEAVDLGRTTLSDFLDRVRAKMREEREAREREQNNEDPSTTAGREMDNMLSSSDIDLRDFDLI